MKKHKSIVLNQRLIDFDTPKVMAIINITPDSFFVDSRATTESAILSSVENAIGQGASIIDIGGYSTRPNAEVVNEKDEGERICFALKIIRDKFPQIPISVDTFRAKVAQMAVMEYGANMINDISGGMLDEAMFSTMAKLNVPYVLMHSRGNPQTMQKLTTYNDIIPDILQYFAKKIDNLRQSGFVSDIILDLGFGFAKTVEQNYKLLANQHVFECFDLPILTGISRKSMINKVLDIAPSDALNGTTVINTLALMNGANILRVHDVKEAMEAITIVDYYKKH